MEREEKKGTTLQSADFFKLGLVRAAGGAGPVIRQFFKLRARHHAAIRIARRLIIDISAKFALIFLRLIVK